MLWFDFLFRCSIVEPGRWRMTPFAVQRPSFPGVFLYSACYSYAVRVYRNLGETTRVSYSACLTIWVTHAPSTGVRATTVLSFPQPSPLLWGTNVLDSFHDFSRQISFHCVLCSIMGMCSFTSFTIGGWGRRKAGDWGRKPGRGRGIAAGLPPFPRVVSPRQR